MEEFAKLAKTVVAVGTVVTTVVTGVWSVLKYFDTKKREQNRLKFDNFYKILEHVVDPKKGSAVNFFYDIQAAYIYELRYFKRYHPFSLRLLRRLKNKWEKENTHPLFSEEINNTINYIEHKLGCFCKNCGRRLDEPSRFS